MDMGCLEMAEFHWKTLVSGARGAFQGFVCAKSVFA